MCLKPYFRANKTDDLVSSTSVPYTPNPKAGIRRPSKIDTVAEVNGDPLWSARCLHNRPDLIRGVHLDFLRAGADVIITSSYQACVNGFCKELGVSEDEAKDLLRLSVRLAVEARDVHLQENPGRRDRPPLIAGSVGPFGAYNSPDAAEYHGNYVDSMSVEDLKRWHTSRIECMLSEKVDILAIETIPAQVEAEAVVGLLRDYPNARAWVTFSCRNGKETCHGENFAKACSVVSKSEQVLAVGVNCTSPLYVEDLLLSAKGTTGSKPFIVYPNSGEMYSEKKWVDLSPIPEISELVPKWINAGARAIGGCCRTSPQHISNIKAAILKHTQSQ